MKRGLLHAVALCGLANGPTLAQSPLYNVPTKRLTSIAPKDTFRFDLRGDTVRLITPSAVIIAPRGSADEAARMFGRGAQVAATKEEVDPTGAWVGATLAYNFASSGPAADKISVAGQVALNNWNPGWSVGGFQFKVPVIGNVAKPTTGENATEQLENKAQQLLSSSDGIYAGLAPSLMRAFGSAGYAMKFYGTLTVRSNALKDHVTDSTFMMTHGRFSLGVLCSIGQFDAGTGVIGIETAYARFKSGDYKRAYGEDRKGLRSTELNVIIPIAANVGMLGQYVLNHTSGDNVWRGGVVLKPASGK